MELADFKVGCRVELHPATDAWMFGDRFGEVVKIGSTRGVPSDKHHGTKLVHVRCDRSGKLRRLAPHNISRIV